VIATSRSARLAVLAVFTVLALIAGCGPTATSVRRTLPPRSVNPGGSADPAGTPTGGGPGGPAGSVVPPDPGIAQPMTSFPQGNAYEVSAVTATPNGFVAVGNAGDESYIGPQQGVVWTSADGLTWQQKVEPAFVDVTPDTLAAVGNDLYVVGYYQACADSVTGGDGGDDGGDGGGLIDGNGTDDGTDGLGDGNDIDQGDCDIAEGSGTVIFKSSDGAATWEQLPQLQEIVDAQFDGLTAWNDKLVAWGSAADDVGTTTIWTSTDGLNWAPVTNIGHVDPVYTLAIGGPGMVALGTEYDENTDVDHLVGATTADGAQFADAAMPQVSDSEIYDSVAGPNGGLVAVGYATSDESPSMGMAIYSGDGLSWNQGTAADGSFENTTINDVHATDNAYVAIGSAVSNDDLTLQTGRVWISADGHSWRSLGDFGGSFTDYNTSALGTAGLVMFTGNENYSEEDDEYLGTSLYGWFLPASQLTP
jgi:hypothetical protein